MSTNSNQNTPRQDEIDLLTLFSKLGEGIKKGVLWLISATGAILVFLLRKWYYFAVAILLTIVSTYILSRATEPVYHSDMIIRSNASTNQTVMSSLEKLGVYARSHNYDALAAELNLSIDDVSNLKGLETFWLYDIGDDGIYDGIDLDGSFLSDTSVVKLENEFVVRIRLSNPEYVKNLETSLINYIEANPYLISLNKQRLSELEAQLIQTSYEIEKLDSLQKREYYTNPDHLRQQESQIVFTSEKTVRTYHNDMLMLLELQQECERDLNIYSDIVTVIEGFTIPGNPDNESINYVKKLIWYFLGFALLLALIITFRKKIWIPKDSQ